MSTPKFVGDANREPQLRIGVLTATLRHTQQGVDLALALLGHDADGARTILAELSAELGDTLAAIAKADGT